MSQEAEDAAIRHGLMTPDCAHHHMERVKEGPAEVTYKCPNCGLERVVERSYFPI